MNLVFTGTKNIYRSTIKICIFEAHNSAMFVMLRLQWAHTKAIFSVITVTAYEYFVQINTKPYVSHVAFAFASVNEPKGATMTRRTYILMQNYSSQNSRLEFVPDVVARSSFSNRVVGVLLSDTPTHSNLFWQLNYSQDRSLSSTWDEIRWRFLEIVKYCTVQFAIHILSFVI